MKLQIITQPEFNRWYNSDCIPSIGTDAVVRMKDGSIDVVRVYNDGRWIPTWPDGWRKVQTFEITHWMVVDIGKLNKEARHEVTQTLP